MADKKISALTGASTPLAGTEVLPIVQGGATVKVSVANLTAGRAVATAGGSFTDNFTQSTAAKGVDFSANTGAAGKTSTLLNWYEEGTWTPAFTNLTVVNGTGGVTYSGTYTRIGRLVYWRASILPTGTATTAATAGTTYINNFPFAIGTSRPTFIGVSANFAISGTGWIVDATQGRVFTWAANNNEIYFSGVYESS